jgi:hypothetical protein
MQRWTGGFWWVGVICLVVLVSSCSGTATDKNEGSAPLTYQAVRADPAKYAGKSVTWVGAVASSTITADAIINFWQVDGEGEGFVFATNQDDETRTASAEAHGKIQFDFTRTVTGTISKKLVEFKQGGEVIMVPLLTKVVVDVPDTVKRQ